MKTRSVIGFLSLALVASLLSCVDDKYDLSDIDTTTEIKVDDLVIPFNLDELKLSTVIEIKDDSELTEVTINGETFYAVNKSGDFTSEDITVPSFTANAPTVTSNVISFSGISTPDGLDLHVPLTSPAVTTVNYEAENLDPAIILLTGLYVSPAVIDIVFSSSEYSHMETVSMTDMEIDFVKGLIVEADATGNVSYDKGTGLLNVKELKFDNTGKATISLKVSGIEDLVKNGYGLAGEHFMNINATIAIKKATINVTNVSNIPSSMSFAVDYHFPTLNFTGFSGKIKYSIDGISLDPVVINDLPSFLASEETNLVLANPQIYLSLSNPVSQYNLEYQTGLSITPVHESTGAGTPLTLDVPYFTVLPGSAGAMQNFCLSPLMPTNIPSDFASGINHIGFTSLSDVLAGAGIPKELYLDLIYPQIPEQDVNHFLLNNKLPGVTGKWEFLAPIAFKAGSDSRIVYTDRADGWSTEDLEALTITSLKLSMTVDNNLPLDAQLSGSPLDTNGKPIQGVSIKPVTLAANTPNQQVEIVVEGTVTHLDGFEFTAVVGSNSGIALSPNQTLSLKNIRARVSGTYTKKL